MRQEPQPVIGKSWARARLRRVALIATLLLALTIVLYSSQIRFATSDTKITPITFSKGRGTYKLQNPNGIRQIDSEPDWSQGGQPSVIDHELSSKRSGFFVEVGGLDGEEFSNTLFFEKNRDWDGLLIEANPYTYRQMLKKDRRCYMAHHCISSDVAAMTFKVAGAVTSAIETMSKKHAERISKDIPVYGHHSTWQGSGSLVTTQCTTLNALMRRIGRTHIDFFSLDVEGAELHILKSIDFRTLSFDLVLIEIQEHREEIKNFMESQGFKHVQELSNVSNDDLYKFLPEDDWKGS